MGSINVLNVGDVFHHLTVKGKAPKIPGESQLFWECLCVCGKVTKQRSTKLLKGIIKSCGCKKTSTATKHGMYGTREYETWHQMVQRTTNPKNTNWEDYGKRGITIDPEWLKFENFYKDMGPRPEGTYTLDRENNNLGYNKENCRWATKVEQTSNRRNTAFIEYKGELIPRALAAKRAGIPLYTLNNRLKSKTPQDVFRPMEKK